MLFSENVPSLKILKKRRKSELRVLGPSSMLSKIVLTVSMATVKVVEVKGWPFQKA